jgi:hypothetical protein
MTQREDARDDAMESFIETFADDIFADQVGPVLTCGEAEILAKVLDAYGEPDAAQTLIKGHRKNCIEPESTTRYGCAPE